LNPGTRHRTGNISLRLTVACFPSNTLLYYAPEDVGRREIWYKEAFEIAKECLSMFQEALDKGHHSIPNSLYKVAWYQSYVSDVDGAKAVHLVTKLLSLDYSLYANEAFSSQT